MVWPCCIAAPESKAAKTQFQHPSPCAPTTVQAGTKGTEFHVLTADLSTTIRDRTTGLLFSVYLAMVCLLWKTCISRQPLQKLQVKCGMVHNLSAWQHTPRNLRNIFTSVLNYMNEDLGLKHPPWSIKPSTRKLTDSWFEIGMNSYQLPCKLGKWSDCRGNKSLPI